jgi:peptide deformylase
MNQAEEMDKRDSDGVYNMLPNPDVLGISPKLKPILQLLVYWPDTRLSEKCKDVSLFDDELGQIVLDLTFTMTQMNGIGIAAPQIGKLINIIIIEEQLDYSHPVVLINPKILEVNEKYSYKMTEGCLSVPGYYEERSRPQSVTVEYNTPSGEKKTKEFQGLAAFVVQHEMDHLEGKVFVDELSRLKQGRVLKKIKKTRKVGVR